MFKCTECGTEYTDKPNFCDCGNDIFQEIKEDIFINEKTLNVNVQKLDGVGTKSDVHSNNFNSYTFSQNSKKSFSVQYPCISKFLNSIDPISGIVFIFCIVLSIIVALIPVTDSKTVNAIAETHQEYLTVNIPSIDAVWNSIPPKQKTAEIIKKQETSDINIKEQNIAKIKTPVAAPSNKTVAKLKTVAVVKNTTQTKQKSEKSSNNLQTVKQNINKQESQKQKNQAQVPMQVQVQAQPKTQTTENKNNPKQDIAPAKTVSTSDPAVIAAEKAKKNVEEIAELNNYKIGLRNLIGRKIDFSKVIGDGNCTVAFKINQSGQIVNRSFVNQSDNITLNDAVYKAVLTTPSYNKPPKGYNNETLNLVIKIYNGNFEIYLN